MTEIMIAVIGAVASIITSGCGFGLVCVFGTKFVNASRELIRDSIVKDYMEFYAKKEIPRLRRESLDRKYNGLMDMKPSVDDKTIQDMFTEIRKWKITD